MRDFITVLIVIFAIAGNVAHADDEVPHGDIASLIEEILVEEVEQTIDKARDIVRENTGIDIGRRGYSRGKHHRPLPGCASEEARRELHKMQGEYNREIYELEDELDRKLAKAEAEFEREAAREDRPEKVYKKRGKLEEKVNKAYADFDEKVAKQNQKYDEKRDKILNKERASEHCRGN